MISAVEESAYLGRFRHAPLECAVCALGLLLVAWIGPAFYGAALVLIASLLLQLCAGVTPWRVVRSLFIPAGFLFVGGLGLAVSVHWDSGLRVTSSAFQQRLAVETVLRSLAATSALFLLMFTVPVHRIGVFLRWLRIPAEIVELFFLMYRTIAVLGESLVVLLRAQNNRLGNRSWKARLHGAGALAANLFVLSQQKARQMELGLAARGYTGELRVLTPSVSWSLPRLLTAAGFPLIVLATSRAMEYYVTHG